MKGTTGELKKEKGQTIYSRLSVNYDYGVDQFIYAPIYTIFFQWFQFFIMFDNH